MNLGTARSCITLTLRGTPSKPISRLLHQRRGTNTQLSGRKRLLGVLTTPSVRSCFRASDRLDAAPSAGALATDSHPDGGRNGGQPARDTGQRPFRIAP